MELSKVSSIHSLISEDTIDTEALDRLETLRVVSSIVQGPGRDRGGVGSKNVLHSLSTLPLVTITRTVGEKERKRIPKRAKATVLMLVLDNLKIVLRNADGLRRILDEESILSITSRVRLRLEESIEVPEGRLDELVGRHFIEAHLQENFSELITDLEERVEVTTTNVQTKSVVVVTRHQGQREEHTA